MAEETDKDQKTHAPSDKKLEDARKKGDVASAPEIRHAAMFAGLLVAVGSLGLATLDALERIAAGLWGHAETLAFTPDATHRFAAGLTGQLALALAPMLAALFGFALIGGLLQQRPMIAWSRVAPKWSKLSPIGGAKRLFGAKAWVEFAKTVAKLVAVCLVAWIVISPLIPGFDRMVGLDPAGIGRLAGEIGKALLRTIAILVGAIALADFVWQRQHWLGRMRMSLQELKDEHKQQEGDPKIKAKIRQIGMQRARRRMMAAVPGASVVITNPTHFAVALRYDHGAMAAPMVVAKGTDAVALKIREIAAAHGVPLVENRPLARALHASAEIDRPIPVEHYTAVAEVISFVLKLARERSR